MTSTIRPKENRGALYELYLLDLDLFDLSIVMNNAFKR